MYFRPTRAAWTLPEFPSRNPNYRGRSVALSDSEVRFFTVEHNTTSHQTKPKQRTRGLSWSEYNIKVCYFHEDNYITPPYVCMHVTCEGSPVVHPLDFGLKLIGTHIMRARISIYYRKHQRMGLISQSSRGSC